MTKELRGVNQEVAATPLINSKNHRPGRELDALIAVRVFGLVQCQGLRHDGNFPNTYCYATPDSPTEGAEARSYSTDIADAWSVVEKLRESGWVYCTVQSFPEDQEPSSWDDSTMEIRWWVEFSRYRSPVEATSPECETPATAICLAALRALDA